MKLKTEKMNLTTVIKEDYMTFAMYAVYSRAVPGLIDGLKPSQRKAIWIASKRARSMMKVVALTGYVFAEGNYAHGDMSLHGAITNLAKDFPGQNNIPWFDREGSFGSKLKPNEAGQARYIKVKYNSKADNILFCDREAFSFTEQDDGDIYEPDTFLPLIPVPFINGSDGIAVGLTNSVFPRNPIDIYNATKDALINGCKPSLNKIAPWFKGFHGKVYRKDDKWFTCGKIERKSKNKVIIVEVQIGNNSDKVLKKLFKLKDNKVITSVVNNSKKEFNIEVSFKSGELDNLSDMDILIKLGLDSSLGSEFLTFIAPNGTFKEYKNFQEYMVDFLDIRLEYVSKWKETILIDLLNKSNFIKGKIKIILELLLIIEKNKKVTMDDLKSLWQTWLPQEEFSKVRSIPIDSITLETLKRLKEEFDVLQNEYKLLDAKSVNDLYIEKLKAIRKYLKC